MSEVTTSIDKINGLIFKKLKINYILIYLINFRYINIKYI